MEACYGNDWPGGISKDGYTEAPFLIRDSLMAF